MSTPNKNKMITLPLETIGMIADLQVALMEETYEEFNSEDCEFLLKANQKIKEYETQKRINSTGNKS